MPEDQRDHAPVNGGLGTVRDFCLVAVADRVAQLEVALGEGPTFEAVASALPTAVDDLRSPVATHRWPIFATEAAVAGIRAVHAYPIVLGHQAFGAVAFYSRQPVRLTSVQHRLAEDITELIGLALVDPRSGEKVGTSYRMSVHQAAGMVMMQAGTSIHDALVLLRSTAFAEDTRVTDLAADVIAGRRRFDRTEEVDD